VLTSHIELFAKFEYTHANGVLIGGPSGNEVSFIGNTLPNDLDFESRWSDYNSYGGELGIRYFFLSKEAKIRPYVSISGGATWVDAIGLHVDSEFFGSEFVLYNGSFYDSTIVPTVSGLLGVEFNVTCHFAVGMDAGVKWTGELDSDDSGFPSSATSGSTAGTPGFFEDLAARSALSFTNNNGADRLSFPVTVYAKFRF